MLHACLLTWSAVVVNEGTVRKAMGAQAQPTPSQARGTAESNCLAIVPCWKRSAHVTFTKREAENKVILHRDARGTFHGQRIVSKYSEHSSGSELTCKQINFQF